MKRKITVIAAILLFILSVSAAVSCSSQKEEQVIYNIYFGLNDSQTKAQVVTTEQAKETIRGTLLEKGLGYTEYEVFGGYPDNGEVRENVTLMYQIFADNKDDIISAAEKAKSELNLDTVFIAKFNGEFYYG